METLMSLELLAKWVAQHGAETEITPKGVRIGVYYCSTNADGSYSMGVEWSKPVKSLVAAAKELGY
jgi:hypothetical protein